MAEVAFCCNICLRGADCFFFNRFAKKGKTLVWFYAPNYATNGENDVSRISNLTGISVKESKTPHGALIVDGKVFVQDSFGHGLQPRSAIGQTYDGEILMLVVDGRRVGHSLGCTVGDLSEIMLRHKAYQAMNLDGGSSSIITYNGKVINRPSSKTDAGRYLPCAFIVEKVNN